MNLNPNTNNYHLNSNFNSNNQCFGHTRPTAVVDTELSFLCTLCSNIIHGYHSCTKPYLHSLLNVAMLSGEHFELVGALFNVPCCEVGVGVTTNGALRKLKRVESLILWPSGRKLYCSLPYFKTYIQMNTSSVE